MTLPINQIICGDCQVELSKLPDNSIDMIFVDPPYGKDGIYLYEVIAKEAARILKPGKFTIFYASEYWFDKIFIDCSKHLNYFSLFHQTMTHGNSVLHPRKLFVVVKTFMLFSKEKAKPLKYLPNIVPSGAKEKSHRKDNWEQSIDDAKFFIGAFSKENDIILDPNVGSGTTCVAAKQLGRQYIGMDISEEYCNIANERIKNDPIKKSTTKETRKSPPCPGVRQTESRQTTAAENGQ